MTELLWADITAEMWDDQPEAFSLYDATLINTICKSGRTSRAAFPHQPPSPTLPAGGSPT